ncbi:ferrous iron transporter B [Anaerosporomusa subterranea]|uniref:Ferrous iron transport protein B n=1 Tax=Anaerosporomusa subterranea TaxID=1794912 RepID=A0A154BQN2_ANASB|nr:ferrous iron transport protein B [Anaerosporomusa subterranea]KYZ76246.1 ferrous iron transporter B [Anaerosporomusa subterranea]
MSAAALTVALAGNPNCGKTTLFNNLTGARQKVGNYPGVTVEKREGFCHCRIGEPLRVIDLPGTYSLTAYSEDERVARRYIVRENPDVVANVVDASNLERNLYLTVQLLELERPSVLVLNMTDVADSRGIRVNDKILTDRLGVSVERTVGSRNLGTDELAAALACSVCRPAQPFTLDYGPEVENAIAVLQGRLSANKLEYPARWTAIKLLENDAEIVELVSTLPDGQSMLALAGNLRADLEQATGIDPEMLIANQRYGFVQTLILSAMAADDSDMKTTSDRIDAVLTHRIFGLPIFFGLMWLLFTMVFTFGEYPQTMIEDGFAWLGEFIGATLPDGGLKSLLVEGVIGGVGGVVVFLPNILLLFLGISILEDSGYMARAAFLMDRVMRSAGLHGKSFIPLLLGFGCNVPAIMGARTLDNPRDRLVTILVTPLMSCSARLPVYTVLIAAFFNDAIAGAVLFSIYFLGIVMAIVMAKLFRSVLFPGESEPFVMEMPPYHLPSVRSTLLHMWERAILYLKKAGTIILAVSVLVWFLTNYPGAAPEESYAGIIGHFFEPVLTPLGFDWRIAVSLFAGFTAKEVLVSTLGTIYAIGANGDTAMSLTQALAADPMFSPVTAYALMVFVLLYAPCLPTVAVIRRETNSWKWAGFSVIYPTLLAWVMAYAVVQIGRLIV